MPKLKLAEINQTNVTGYPPPFNEPVKDRWYRRLAPPSGLTHIGVSHVTLKSGAWSSQRHWHEGEDEMVIILSGEAVLVEDDAETIMRAGDIAAFPAGEQNGHHLQNRTDADCVFVAMAAGDRSAGGSYSDIDMEFREDGYYTRSGERYDTERIP